jgi:hypothetical protein
MALTGRFDFRRTMTGQLRLWLEYESNGFWDFITRKKTYCRHWRKAHIMDLAAPELRHLVDMRLRNSPEMPSGQKVVRGWPEKVREEHEAALIEVRTAEPNGEGTKPNPLP